jgi:hypothetical protein
MILAGSPVIVADGHSFERAAIARWLAAHETNPVTGARLAHRKLVANHGTHSARPPSHAIQCPAPTERGALCALQVSNLGLRDASLEWAATHRPDEHRQDETRGAWAPNAKPEAKPEARTARAQMADATQRLADTVARLRTGTVDACATGASASAAAPRLPPATGLPRAAEVPASGWRFPAPGGWRPNYFDEYGDEIEWRLGEGMVSVEGGMADWYDEHPEDHDPNPNRRHFEVQLACDPSRLRLYLAERERTAAARATLAEARRRGEEVARQRGREARAAAAAGPRDRFGNRRA